MEAEELITRSPMVGIQQPTIPDEPVPLITEDELGRLLKATSGKGFERRRDHAILRVLLDTGVRLSELVGLAVNDVDLDAHDVIHIRSGKGG
jgi:site-specific recombinase XerD